MRLGALPTTGRDFDEMVARFFGDTPAWTSGAFSVPTDVFRAEDRLVIRMDLPGVVPDDVEVTLQENYLIVNGTRRFPYEPEKVRFVRRGAFYGEFTQRVALGKGLNTEQISAAYNNGVLELTIPYAEEVQPRKISVQVGGTGKALES